MVARKPSRYDQRLLLWQTDDPVEGEVTQCRVRQPRGGVGGRQPELNKQPGQPGQHNFKDTYTVYHRAHRGGSLITYSYFMSTFSYLDPRTSYTCIILNRMPNSNMKS